VAKGWKIAGGGGQRVKLPEVPSPDVKGPDSELLPCIKVGYRRQAEAAKEAKRTAARAYHCKVCRQFHLTTSPKKKHRERE
jgi:hypothetical protein